MNPVQNQHNSVLSDTHIWLERAVIGLNLCPFAKAVQVRNQIHFALSLASEPQQLLAELRKELSALVALPATVRETTLLIAPECLHDFLDFNDFLDAADQVLLALGLEGVVQIASFHPQFQFAGTAPDDIGNYSNRSPYPTLHLLREASVAQALAAYPQAERIFEKNIQTLENLGYGGWAALAVGPRLERSGDKP